MSSTVGIRGRASLNGEAGRVIAEAEFALAAVGPESLTQRLFAARSALRTCADAAEELFECRYTTAVGDLVNLTRTAQRLVEVSVHDLLASRVFTVSAPGAAHCWDAQTVLRRVAVPLLRLGNILWATTDSPRIHYVSEQLQRVAGQALALTTRTW
ncbi:hypothetical protein GCM10022247_05000 [Allokutzneria multivorans]|uniref:Uncharacterized protein n=1 Tax=Allokutzneria multivorans TaxID=1142134 RepID=A0ABP7QXD1_9PSEU